MFEINNETKKIAFQKKFKIGSEPLKTFECDLISGYVCPKCKEILLAYFKTDEFIPVWRYDEKVKDSNYDREKDRKDYRYRVFYAGCGVMGIELKNHNNTYGDDECNYKIHQCYSIIESVNYILKEIEEKLRLEADSESKEKKIDIEPLPTDFDKQRLVRNLERNEGVRLISDVCKKIDPLLHFEIRKLKYEEVDTLPLEYGSKEKKEAEKKNFENMKEAYTKFVQEIST